MTALTQIDQRKLEPGQWARLYSRNSRPVQLVKRSPKGRTLYLRTEDGTDYRMAASPWAPAFLEAS